MKILLVKKEELRRFEGKQVVFVLDIETTGLNFNYDMICEIGICLLNMENASIIPIFDSICKESDKYIDENAWIFSNSDLSYEEVKNAEDLENFTEDLKFILEDVDLAITAYNQKFDFGFLVNRGFQIQNRFWDAMLKLTPILELRRYNGDYKFPSVQEAWNYLFPNDHYIEKHRALDDAIHEAKIIFETNRILEERYYGKKG